MGDPIVIRNPTMSVQELDAAGDPVGTPADVTPDVASLALAPSLPSSTITTFAGKFTAMSDPEWGTATAGIVNNADTQANWADLVGKRVEVKVYDRDEFTWYRRFESEVVYNPAIAGTTAPGQARTHDFPLPVLSAVSIETEAP